MCLQYTRSSTVAKDILPEPVLSLGIQMYDIGAN